MSTHSSLQLRRDLSYPQQACQDLLHLHGEGKSIVELRTGKMDPKVANALGYLGASFLRALELADIESRLEKMEAQLDYAAQATAHVRGQGGSDRA